MKSDGRLARSPLKGRTADAIFAVLCACGHNVWRIFAHLRALWALFPSLMPAWLRPQNALSTRSTGRLTRLFNADPDRVKTQIGFPALSGRGIFGHGTYFRR